MRKSNIFGLSLRTLAVISAAAISVSSLARAQTNGTWQDFTGLTNKYSDPTNWVGGIVPDAGGTATFGPTLAFDPGFGRVVTVDSSPTLSLINISSESTYLFQGTGTLNLAAAGGTFNVTNSQAAFPFTAFIGHEFDCSIAGGALIKTGSGAVTLSPDGFAGNTYVGGTFINGGTLYVTSDAALGDSSGNVTLNGGTLGILGSIITSRNIIVGPAGGGLQTFGDVTFNGPVSGSSTLSVPFLQNGTVTFGASNTFSGRLVIGGGSVVLTNAGSLAAATTVDFSGNLTLDNTSTVLSNRLGNTTNVVMRSSTLEFDTSSSVTQQIGVLAIDNGASSITMTATGGVGTLRAASLSRLNRSTLYVNGTALGATSGTASNLSIAANPGLLGGGGAAGTTTISVIPYAVGNSDPTLPNSDPTTSLLTWNATNGNVRPLAANEYASTLAGSTATTNVRLAAAYANTVAVSANSLSLQGPAAISVTGTGTITVASGAIVVGASSGGVAAESFLATPIEFGAAEGILHAFTPILVNNRLNGTNGLTITGAGDGSFSADDSGISSVSFTGQGASSSYTGITTINDTFVYVAGNVPNAANSAFGNSSTAIVLNTGAKNLVGLFFSKNNSTMSRPLSITGAGLALIGDETDNATSSYATTWAGAISIAAGADLELYNFSRITLSGVISGGGMLSDFQAGLRTSGATVNINGSNTYSGGTEISASKWVIGNDSAFGTGTVFVDGYFDGATFYEYGTLTATGSVRTLANKFQINQGVSFSNVSGGSLVLTGTVDLTGSFTTLACTGTTTLAGVVANGGIEKEGTGTLVLLSNSNTYLGQNLVTAGTLALGNGGATGDLGDAYGVSVSAAGTVSVNRSNTYTAIGFTFYGDGTFAQTGTGTTYIVGTNPITGLVRVSSGTLSIGSGTATGDFGSPASYTVAATGTLQFAHTNDLVIGSPIAGPGTVAQTGTGTTFLTVSNALTGRMNVSAGILAIGSNTASGTLGTAPVTVTGSGTLAFDRSDVLSFATNISGTGNVSKIGDGITTLTGTLSYTGNTTVTASTLNMASPVRSTTSTLTVVGGTNLNINIPGSAAAVVVASEFGTLNIAGSAAVLATNRPTVKETVLLGGTLNLTGSLDLANNDALFRSTSEATLDTLVFNGLLYPSSATPLTSLAVITNSDGMGGALFTTFDGVPSASTDVLVKYTYIGDTDLNGVVNGADLENLLAGLNGHLHGYVNGDLNYDGTINAIDLSLLLNSLQNQGASLGISGGTGAVPEPTTLAPLALATLATRRRRR